MPKSVPKLSNMAAMKIASRLLHQKIIDEYPWNQNVANYEILASLLLYHVYRIIPLGIHNWSQIRELMMFPLWKETPQIFFLASELKIMTEISPLKKDQVPNEVNAIINRAGIRMAFELWSWIYLHCNIFNDRITLEIIIVRLFDEFVWYPDGTLNDEETAQNLVNSPKLSDYDKFSLACEYCMEKDIQRLWSVVESDSKLRNVLVQNQTTMSYWIYKMKNPQNFPALEENIMEMITFYNRLSIEYFWNFIEPDEQVSQITRLISNTSSCIKTLPYIIEKLSDRQFKELVTSVGEDLMIYVIETMSKPELILKLWIRMKDLINEVEFFKILQFIFQYEWEVCINYPFGFELIEKFKQIWTTAPNILKEYVLDQWTLDGGASFLLFM